MAALAITKISTTAGVAWQQVRFAASASQGAVCYKEIKDGQEVWRPAQCDGTALEAGQSGLGIVFHAIDVPGQYGVIVTAGTIVLQAAPADGTTYVLGEGAGEIVPEVDFAGFASGRYKTIIGVGGDAVGSGAELVVKFFASGIQK